MASDTNDRRSFSEYFLHIQVILVCDVEIVTVGTGEDLVLHVYEKDMKGQIRMKGETSNEILIPLSDRMVSRWINSK
eukprot:scaffold865_cov87-Cylindrotheca_fusiformis.AAC.6